MGGESRTAHQKLYINVMESLVAEEVSRQLSKLPERVSKYVKRVEVETFALNRLPAFYASSEKGLQHQYERALHDYKPQIVSAVRQAFAAVQVDPIRLSQPLQLNQEEEAVLQALRELLQQPELSWNAALQEIQRIQNRRQASGKTASSSSSADSPSQPTAQEIAQEAESRSSTAWRPGTYGSRLGWKPHQKQSSKGDGFGENAR